MGPTVEVDHGEPSDPPSTPRFEVVEVHSAGDNLVVPVPHVPIRGPTERRRVVLEQRYQHATGRVDPDNQLAGRFTNLMIFVSVVCSNALVT